MCSKRVRKYRKREQDEALKLAAAEVLDHARDNAKQARQIDIEEKQPERASKREKNSWRIRRS